MDNTQPTSTLIRVCAWCQPQRLINADDNPGAVIDMTTIKALGKEITHGICKVCYQKALLDQVIVDP